MKWTNLGYININEFNVCFQLLNKSYFDKADRTGDAW